MNHASMAESGSALQRLVSDSADRLVYTHRKRRLLLGEGRLTQVMPAHTAHMFTSADRSAMHVSVISIALPILLLPESTGIHNCKQPGGLL